MGGQREGGQAPQPPLSSPPFPACPAEAETRQRLLRTVKKEVGAATPGRQGHRGHPAGSDCAWLTRAGAGEGFRGEGSWVLGV